VFFIHQQPGNIELETIMKKSSRSIYIILISSLLLLTYCNSGNPDSSDQVSNLIALDYLSYTEIAPLNNVFTDFMGTGYEYYHLDIPEQTAGDNVSFDYTFETGTETKDIYFIFTNISPDKNTTYPILESSQSVTQSALPAALSKPKSLLQGGQTMKGKPEISEFNRNPYAYLNKINPINMILNFATPSEPKYDYETEETTFRISANYNVDATCVKINTDGTKTLNLWVANNCGDNHDQSCTTLSYTRPISDIADTFLKADTDNDIYDWITNIYSEEWGSVPSSIDPDGILIPPNNEITILLLDIDNNQSTDSGVLGYFWAKDNFKRTSYLIPTPTNFSNERIMFYIDAYLYKNHPDEIISALAHEFQHMIHFYQKTVMLTNGKGTETWIDEMSSMATEDLVADKLGVDGPRGVSPTTFPLGSAGTFPITTETGSRLPHYNYYNDASVTEWYKGDEVLKSYSINYALGAYLSRNYGGAQFFHDVMHNDKTGYEAIEYALNKAGSPNKFGDILARWGVANLLSDMTNVPSDYRYNIETWFISDTDPVTVPYKAGSINLYNYRISYYGNIQDGPHFYTESYPMPTTPMPAASNEYYRAAQNLTGSQTWHIKLRKNVRMSVLAK
jgi:hypothetical protein